MSEKIEKGDVVYLEIDDSLYIVDYTFSNAVFCITDDIKLTSCGKPIDVVGLWFDYDLTLISKGDFA